MDDLYDSVVKSPERPPFSTNIFDGCEPSPPQAQAELREFPEHEEIHEHELESDSHWFRLSTVVAIFFIGVASSYYIIHHY